MSPKDLYWRLDEAFIRVQHISQDLTEDPAYKRGYARIWKAVDKACEYLEKAMLMAVQKEGH